MFVESDCLLVSCLFIHQSFSVHLNSIYWDNRLFSFGNNKLNIPTRNILSSKHIKVLFFISPCIIGIMLDSWFNEVWLDHHEII